MMHSTAERKALLEAAAKQRKPRGTHQGRRLRMEGTRMECPHCKATSEIRTSKPVSATMRETIYQCTNVECGHTFVANTEIVRTLSPSATPDPTVNLPMSTHVRRDMLRVVLDNAGAAEHQALFTSPVTGDLFAGDKPAGASS
ncbi:ogr/Delta-like zinc finger family protein [Comamonas sp. J-3]|uniref:ogr/Delta-like zinc finger family protein n=1 Tax=Comamonas trifloxystrobinivorans TaxID=3350256 RepID=UPI00372B7553